VPWSSFFSVLIPVFQYPTCVLASFPFVIRSESIVRSFNRFNIENCLEILSQIIVTKERSKEKEKEMSDYFVQWFFRSFATCPIFLPSDYSSNRAINLRNPSNPGPELMLGRCDTSFFKFAQSAWFFHSTFSRCSTKDKEPSCFILKTSSNFHENLCPESRH